MEKQKKVDFMRSEAMTLRVEYLHTKDPKKGTRLLKTWSKKMDAIHRVQDQINSLFIEINTNDSKNYSTQQVLPTIGWYGLENQGLAYL